MTTIAATNAAASTATTAHVLVPSATTIGQAATGRRVIGRPSLATASEHRSAVTATATDRGAPATSQVLIAPATAAIVQTAHLFRVATAPAATTPAATTPATTVPGVKRDPDDQPDLATARASPADSAEQARVATRVAPIVRAASARAAQAAQVAAAPASPAAGSAPALRARVGSSPADTGRPRPTSVARRETEIIVS